MYFSSELSTIRPLSTSIKSSRSLNIYFTCQTYISTIHQSYLKHLHSLLIHLSLHDGHGSFCIINVILRHVMFISKLAISCAGTVVNVAIRNGRSRHLRWKTPATNACVLFGKVGAPCMECGVGTSSAPNPAHLRGAIAILF